VSGDLDWIGADYRDAIRRRVYGDAAEIAGVRLLAVTTRVDERGELCVVGELREDGTLEELPGFRPAQINFSVLAPGAVKAWHLHRRQTDVWFVPGSSRLIAGLLDIRAGSASYGASTRFALGLGAQLLVIPPGVAHGMANLGPHPAQLIYLVSSRFNPGDPDEYRLPFDLLGGDFWSIRPG
jgi:dTDP-4-dehydrorhamnose 3,5-epimerase